MRTLYLSPFCKKTAGLSRNFSASANVPRSAMAVDETRILAPMIGFDLGVETADAGLPIKPPGGAGFRAASR
jgi:hypothetical protein